MSWHIHYIKNLLIVDISLNNQQIAMAKSFIRRHRQCVEEPFFSTEGGQFTYLITPTGIGNIVKIKCNICNKVKDITGELG